MLSWGTLWEDSHNAESDKPSLLIKEFNVFSLSDDKCFVDEFIHVPQKYKALL